MSQELNMKVYDVTTHEFNLQYWFHPGYDLRIIDYKRFLVVKENESGTWSLKITRGHL